MAVTYDPKKNGKILRDLRGNKSREEVAAATGICISSLAMYEQGERNPRDVVKQILANYYGKTVADIFYS